MKIGRRGDPPTKKKKESTASVNKKEDEKVQLEGVTTSNIFYADIKDPVERVKAAQKYENDNYNKALKSGNTVTMSSIKTSNPKAYNLLSNSMQPNKDSYGEIEDFAVDKKYANVSSYEELGFPKGYSPEDRKKAIKADKLEEFEKKFGGKSQTSSDPNFGYYTKYKTDEKLKEKFDKDPDRIPILKLDETFEGIGTPKNVGKIIKRTTNLAVPKKAEKEEATWSDPTVNKAPKKIERAGGAGGGSLQMFGHTKIGGNKAGKGIKYALENSGIGRSINYSKAKQELKKEGRGFKSLYGQPSSESGSTLSGMTLGELAKEKKELKSVLRDKEFRGSSAFTRSEMQNERSGIRKDIRATNLASKYTSKNLTPTSVFDKNGVERVEMQPKVNAAAKYYKAEMGDRYTEYTRQEKQKPQNHPANKNTLESQSNALEPKRSRSQRKEETDIQRSVMDKLKNR